MICVNYSYGNFSIYVWIPDQVVYSRFAMKFVFELDKVIDTLDNCDFGGEHY